LFLSPTCLCFLSLLHELAREFAGGYDPRQTYHGKGGEEMLDDAEEDTLMHCSLFWALL